MPSSGWRKGQCLLWEGPFPSSDPGGGLKPQLVGWEEGKGHRDAPFFLSWRELAYLQLALAVGVEGEGTGKFFFFCLFVLLCIVFIVINTYFYSIAWRVFFSGTVYILCYFVLVSGVQHSAQTVIYLQSVPGIPNLAPYIVVTILLTIFPRLYLTTHDYLVTTNL